MIRTYIHYGSFTYVIGHETAETVRGRIEALLEAGTPGWLRVNFGEGQEQPADLLIAPGIPIGVWEADEGD